MTKDLLTLSLGMGALLLATSHAFAAPSCAPRAALTDHLAERFEERRRGIGVAGPAVVVELYAADAGSWTLVATDARGVSCILAAGEAWEALDEPLPAPGDGA